MEDENTETEISTPAFLRKTEQDSAMAAQKSLHVLRRSCRKRWREVKKEVAVKEVKGVEKGEEDDQEEEDREEVEMKIHALQRIVPGGEELGVDKLFDETAGYIMALQHQVKALRALTGFFEKLEKEKTRFGG